jgi:hypothetical protein
MSVSAKYNLKISAENEDASKKAMLVIQSQIESKDISDCIITKDVFDKLAKLHVFEMEFNPWSLPFATYTKLRAIEGISVIARSLDCCWVDEACEYEKVEPDFSGAIGS